MSDYAPSEPYDVSIEIGATPIRIRTTDFSFLKLLQERYRGFEGTAAAPECELDVELHPPSANGYDGETEVFRDRGRWTIRRGDFEAEWDPQSRRGRLRQPANPYSIDTVLRILHTLFLAEEGGFLVHAASVVRNSRAFLFSGVSGAGKTTISRLSPPDATLLTDEISYVRPQDNGYRAFGTPFAGELARLGSNVSAPVAALFFLAKGPENRLEPVGAAEAAHALLRNILFFAKEPEMVRKVFQSACDFVDRVPVRRLVFTPDQRVWEMVA